MVLNPKEFLNDPRFNQFNCLALLLILNMKDPEMIGLLCLNFFGAVCRFCSKKNGLPFSFDLKGLIGLFILALLKWDYFILLKLKLSHNTSQVGG